MAWIGSDSSGSTRFKVILVFALAAAIVLGGLIIRAMFTPADQQVGEVSIRSIVASTRDAPDQPDVTPAPPAPSTPRPTPYLPILVPTGPPPTPLPTTDPDAIIRNFVATEVAEFARPGGLRTPIESFQEDLVFFQQYGLRMSEPLTHTKVEWGAQVDGCDENIDKVMLAVKEYGFVWIKHQVRWGDIEFLNDQMQRAVRWRCSDGAVAEARKHGIKVLLSITTAPAYLRRFSSTSLGPPSDLNAFGEFLRVLIRRYRGSIHAIEVWNEPNLSAEWDEGVNPRAYTMLLKAASLVIRQEAPEIMIISAGLAPIDHSNLPLYMNEIDFFTTMHENGASLWIDCVGYHANGPDGVGYFHQVIRRYRDRILLNQDPRLRRPICLTEVSFSLPYQGQTPPDFAWAMSHTEEQQAAMFERWFRMSRASNFVRLVIVFNMNYTEGGRVTPNSIAALMREDLRGLTLKRLQSLFNGQ